MSKVLSLLLSALCTLLVFGLPATTTSKVKVDMFYETLCRGCSDYFHHQITQTYNKLGSYIDLHLVPFGIGMVLKVNNRTILLCDHGPKECYGNKLHACTIDLIKNVTEYVNYLDCLYIKNSTSTAAEKCAKQLNISKDVVKGIKDCANTDKGLQLLLRHQEYDEKYNHYGIPTIIVDGKELDGNTLLQAAICQKLNNAPQACETKSLVTKFV